MGLMLLGVVAVLGAGIGLAVWLLERDQKRLDDADNEAALVSELETWLNNRDRP